MRDRPFGPGRRGKGEEVVFLPLELWSKGSPLLFCKAESWLNQTGSQVTETFLKKSEKGGL